MRYRQTGNACQERGSPASVSVRKRERATRCPLPLPFFFPISPCTCSRPLRPRQNKKKEYTHQTLPTPHPFPTKYISNALRGPYFLKYRKRRPTSSKRGNWILSVSRVIGLGDEEVVRRRERTEGESARLHEGIEKKFKTGDTGERRNEEGVASQDNPPKVRGARVEGDPSPQPVDPAAPHYYTKHNSSCYHHHFTFPIFRSFITPFGSAFPPVYPALNVPKSCDLTSSICTRQ